MKYLKDLNARVSLKWYGVLSLIIGSLFYAMQEDATILVGIIYTIIMFIILSILGWVQSYEKESTKKRLDKTYGDDPDWEKFKELKTKFRQ